MQAHQNIYLRFVCTSGLAKRMEIIELEDAGFVLHYPVALNFFAGVAQLK